MIPDEILTLKEAAKYLKTSCRTLRGLGQTREIPCFRLGSQWRFEKKRLEQWMAGQACPGECRGHRQFIKKSWFLRPGFLY